MEHLEAKIRDYLFDNIGFISDDLTVIKKEYNLAIILDEKQKNLQKTKIRGSIDILAQDSDGNYVIIEIKRSEKAAREAIDEVIKYAYMLQIELGIRESEIRIFIVSSEWRSLIAQYSDLYHKSAYSLEGIELTLDENGIPIAKKFIKPSDNPLARNVSKAHTIFFSLTNEGIEKIIQEVRKKLLKLGIKDFVLVKMVAQPDPLIIYPFCAYLVHQRYSKYFYLDILKRFTTIDEDDLEDIESTEGNDDAVLYDLENEIIALLTKEIIARNLADDIEIGYPEKFSAASNKWELRRVEREGFFKRDVRLTDTMLVFEIIGLQGSSNIGYVGKAKAEQFPRLKEIEENVFNCLKFNTTWEKHIKYAFSTIQKRKGDFKELRIEVFCPDMTLETLFHAAEDMFNEIPETHFPKYYTHFPMYAFLINFGEEKHLFIGRVKWIRPTHTFKQVIKEVFRSEEQYLLHRHLGSLAKFDAQVMYLLGLEYSSDLQVIRKDSTKIYQDIQLTSKGIQAAPIPPEFYIDDFLKSKFASFILELFRFYSSNIIM